MAVLALPGVAQAVPPANDNFANAEVLGGPPDQAVGSNTEATTEPGEPAHGGDGFTVWYRWTAPEDLTASIDLCGSTFDTLVVVYTGAALDSLVEVARNHDDFEHCDAFQSHLTFDAAAGVTYQIVVDGEFGETGTIDLVLGDDSPPNDDFVSAEVLEGFEDSSTGSNENATLEPGEPSHGGQSVWYRWLPPAGGFVQLRLCKSGFDTVLTVYVGDAVNALTQVATNDDACGKQSAVGFFAVAGVTYLIQVDGADTGRVRLDLAQSMPGLYAGRTGFPDREPIRFKLAAGGTQVKRLKVAATLDCFSGGFLIGELRIKRFIFRPIPLRLSGEDALFRARAVVRFQGGGRLIVKVRGELLPSDRAKGTLDPRARFPGVTCKPFFGVLRWTARH